MTTMALTTKRTRRRTLREKAVGRVEVVVNVELWRISGARWCGGLASGAECVSMAREWGGRGKEELKEGGGRGGGWGREGTRRGGLGKR